MEFLLAADNVADELDAEKISQDVSRLAKFTDSMVDKLINFGFSILVAIIIFVIGKIIIKFVRKFVKKLLLKSTVDLGVVKFIDSIIKVVGYVMVLIIICGEIGIQTTSFITLLGTGGLSIGLALQGSLANFAGGVLILVSKPFIIPVSMILASSEDRGAGILCCILSRGLFLILYQHQPRSRGGR